MKKRLPNRGPDILCPDKPLFERGAGITTCATRCLVVVFAMMICARTTRGQDFSSAKIGTQGAQGRIVRGTLPGQWLVTGGGVDIGGVFDNFTMHSVNGESPFDWQVRLPALEANSFDSKAGLMFRQFSTDGSRMFYVRSTPNGRAPEGTPGRNDVRVQIRREEKNESTEIPVGVTDPPEFPNNWMRLARYAASDGDHLAAYRSVDGKLWDLIWDENIEGWGLKGARGGIGFAASKGTGGKEVFSVDYRDLRFWNSKSPEGAGPVISALPNVDLNREQPLEVLAFTFDPITVHDIDTPGEKLVMSATSSNQELLPNTALILGGSGNKRTLKITPRNDRTGVSIVTVQVTDGNQTVRTRVRVTVTEPVLTFDFGDAPDNPYPTFRNNDGAAQVSRKGFSLGETVDDERDGQPNSGATGDGVDEDGVQFLTPLVQGQPATIRVAFSDVVHPTPSGRLDFFIDFNANGSWTDPGEAFLNRFLTPGNNDIEINVPATAKVGQTFSRFRLSLESSGKPTGISNLEGEVEDHAVIISEPKPSLDYGDAPKNYPVTASANGASHVASDSYKLGKLVDAEFDGQPNAAATGDGVDEDGVVFLDPITAGQLTKIRVTLNSSTQSGRLDAWIDFNQDGDWLDAGEKVIDSFALVNGDQDIGLTIPVDAKPGTTFARFRLSVEGKKDSFGPSTEAGEVEDYLITVLEPQRFDYGDAADRYPVLRAVNGASQLHRQGFLLGQSIDSEPDGQPSDDARGDGLEDDGVTFSGFIPGQPATVRVTFVSSIGNGRLDAWVDWNQDGDWDDPNEQIIAQNIVPGTQSYGFNIPAAAREGATYARFRLSQEGAKLPFNPSLQPGEIEDYLVGLNPAIVHDYGDASEKYPVKLSNNAARQTARESFRLGELIDAEADGQPSATALGDGGDEDGVQFLSAISAGELAQIRVRLGSSIGGGHLDGWIDFNQDGDWIDEGERVLDVNLVVGSQDFGVTIPAGAKAGSTFARFRLSQQGRKESFGINNEFGEIEDYLVDVLPPIQLDFGDAPQNYPVTRAQDGARQIVDPSFKLGKTIDAENDGQPSSTAFGDGSDEDGIQFPDPIVPGQLSRVRVEFDGPAGITGRLDGWIDFNQDGDWLDEGERILSANLPPGVHVLEFNVPSGAFAGSTVARIRLSADGIKESIKPSNQRGEVEDYRVAITPRAVLDYGDAPDTYPVTIGNNGASQIVNREFRLGQDIDDEADGQPSGDASKDGFDEDGVSFSGPIRAGLPATVVVNHLSGIGPGFLDAWVDFNQDFKWTHPAERVISQPLSVGVNTIVFNVPPTAVEGVTFMRFRLSQKQGKLPTGPSDDAGEVEDYTIRIDAEPRDYGDAPEKYPVLRTNNGASHLVDEKFTLGRRIDTEPDGQPNGNAAGDGVDEDGIQFGAFRVGEKASFKVTLNSGSGPGRLNAWIDFNRNFSWEDEGEHVVDRIINPGVTDIEFDIPSKVQAGNTFMRFRLSRKEPLGSGGPSKEEGEVEDYLVGIAEAANEDFGDAPQSPSTVAGFNYPTTLSNNGARHRVNRDFHLGQRIDAEKDGQPMPGAVGDDNNPPNLDDEDGVRFLTPLTAGGTARIEVSVVGKGFLDAFADFNSDGDWSDAGEKVFNAESVNPGLNILSFPVPGNSKGGVTYLRFRLSRQGGFGPAGPGEEGEVEDYVARIIPQRCDLSCTGNDFWFTYPGNYHPHPTNNVRPMVLAVGQAGTVVNISVPGLGYFTNVNIGGAGVVGHVLPPSVDLDDLNDTNDFRGVHVTSTEPIGLYALSKVKYTSDGFMVLPTEILGTSYVVTAYGNLHAAVPELNGTQFAIVATEDETEVTINPSVVTGPHDSGLPYVITLQEGDVYQLRNTNGVPVDLTGTLIDANKPIGVFSGHRCANVASADTFFCDYLVEQQLPVSRWGTEHYVHRLRGRTRDTVRVVASEANTLVLFNAAFLVITNRGEFIERSLTGPARIFSDRPVAVMQFANSSDSDGVVNSDPFMVTIPARPLYVTNHIFTTGPGGAGGGFLEHWANVAVPTAAVASVRLNGLPPGVAFAAIPGTIYSCASIPLVTGRNRISSDLPSGVIVYGWNEYESYGWPACMFFGDTTPPTLNCPTNTVTVPATKTPIVLGNTTIPACRGLVPDLRSQVTARDNCALPREVVVVQEPAPGTPVPVGEHIITLSVADERGNVARCRVKLVVTDPDPNGVLSLECPGTLRIPCTTNNGAVINYHVVLLKGCTPQTNPVVCVPPPGTFLPRGVHQVVCTYDPGDAEPLECKFTVRIECELTLTPLPPVLTTSKRALRFSFEQSSNTHLESSPSLFGPWKKVDGLRQENDVVEVPIGSEGGMFYRLRQDDP